MPGLSADSRFSTNALRVASRDELRRLLEPKLAAATTADWQARLTEAGVPAGEVQDVAGGFALATRLGLEPLVYPAGDGASPLVAHPVTYSGFKPAPARRPPNLAEHDQQVRDWLASPDRTQLKDYA